MLVVVTVGFAPPGCVPKKRKTGSASNETNRVSDKQNKGNKTVPNDWMEDCPAAEDVFDLFEESGVGLCVCYCGLLYLIKVSLLHDHESRLLVCSVALGCFRTCP